MVGSYSPHNDAGGTLHLPSPTHIHHVDPTSAFKELRRSLSRSPSKGPTFRLVSSKSASPISRSPLSPSPETQQGPSTLSTALSLSPFATPLTTSTRKTRPSTRRISPMRSSSRSTSSQRSPRKRTLNESADSGNAPPRSSSGSSDDQENTDRRNTSPVRKPPVVAGLLKASAPSLQSSPLPLPRGTTRFEKGCNDWSVKSSPLKRSDGIMNFDQGGGGSPSAKRRSLHAGIFGADFDIFDQEAAIEGLDTQMTGIDYAMESPPSLRSISPMPKRTSSLRKTTLQQRHEKPSFAKPKAQTDATNETPPSITGLKGRLRASLDSVLPSMSRDSPFSSQGGLPSASAHPLSTQYNRQAGSIGTSQPQRHPLSRTISQSTSNSSMAEDSPTHIPVRQPENHRPFMDFSRSLPVGAFRPEPQEGSSSQLSSGTSFATPENYKLVKPLPAAFMSTGLISKRHKNVEESHPALNASTSTMPDTPCKRHSLAEIPSPTAPPNEIFGKSHQVRHSFGTPSTPFNPHVARASPETFGKGVNIFGAGFGSAKLQRRVSFLGRERDETFNFPSQQGDSQSSAELDIPPTPTKQTLVSAGNQPSAIGIKSARQDSIISASNETDGTKSHPSLPQNCKSFSDETPQRVVRGSSLVSWENTPSAVLRSTGLSAVPRSFTASRLLRNLRSPAPLKESCFAFTSHDDSRSLAKMNSVNPASPLNNPFSHVSPHTPRETMAPPDPSGLSISAHGDDHFRPPDHTASRVSFPPATPTAPRGSVLSFNKSNASVTPSHTPAAVEVDPALTSRFDRVEMIGTGEFSQVFKVSKVQEPKSSCSYFSLPLARGSPKTPLPDRVWAVKKTRHPYIGPKDRQRKLQEVETLRILGQSDHTLELFDSWEDRNHLYIQTEFCEEGSLDMFLENAGRQARLDDFRIWKILLEMSLGIKHIHDSGFIHLDLKPANVLITFEGVLKIADFGMATRWPAPPGTDGEGDREYIGPEILRGEFDKPADVFALGLIVLEIAGNVMLPDNGASWQRLRMGDMSDVPSLTWSSDASNVLRDASGKPLSHTESFEDFYSSESGDDTFSSPRPIRTGRRRRPKEALVQSHRPGELAQPPAFMCDSNNPEAVDSIVRWMISPQAADRPVIDQVLATMGVRWAEIRRRAGATIFEGNWGPADEVLADDSEMIDV